MNAGEYWPAIAAIGTLGGFGISFAVFWLTFGTRIGKAEIEAASGRSEARDAHDKVTLLGTSFSLYREQVAKEYVQREVLREFEERLATAIKELGHRLDRFIEAATARK